ncbi:1547_t:CDS:2 [Entrophospora sp. SA101]|nr:1547_t:CDS:2 [Entrophospora sp. SA101]
MLVFSSKHKQINKETFQARISFMVELAEFLKSFISIPVTNALKRQDEIIQNEKAKWKPGSKIRKPNSTNRIKSHSP